ncbi:UNKNOWN [Stylonychia lemnae]|uniref:Uncharacterized protein n=1 Tax=Stylonychia lemnae TaxID=5949 RepID=A0A078AFH2_STYLE|nr:UNKNOWN [Stylonychia lemnae]|eukprot:CDW79673.1 UNKNOWN [Stylonychia lemnae]
MKSGSSYQQQQFKSPLGSFYNQHQQLQDSNGKYLPIYEQDEESSIYQCIILFNNLIVSKNTIEEPNIDDEYQEFYRSEDIESIQQLQQRELISQRKYTLSVNRFRKGNPKIFQKLYDQALHQQQKQKLLMSSDISQSQESGYLNQSDEIELAKQKKRADSHKTRYVFDSLYQDFYIKRQEHEMKRKLQEDERVLRASSKGKQNSKSVQINNHRAMKDIKGLIMLFKGDNNTIGIRDLSRILFHLSTFNHSPQERQNIIGGMPPSRMKLEIRFEEELWFQFCLSLKERLPIVIALEILKIFYTKNSEQILSHKVQELQGLIEYNQQINLKERQKQLIQKAFDPLFLKYKQVTPKEIINDFLQLNFALGTYKIRDLYSKKQVSEMRQRINEVNHRQDRFSQLKEWTNSKLLRRLSTSSRKSHSSKSLTNIFNKFGQINRPQIQQTQPFDQKPIFDLQDLDSNQNSKQNIYDDDYVQETIEDEGENNNKYQNLNLFSESNKIDLKTINNLKLNKRRTKDFYEENRKKPALFTISSALLNNQNLKETQIMNSNSFAQTHSSRSNSKSKRNHSNQRINKQDQASIPLKHISITSSQRQKWSRGGSISNAIDIESEIGVEQSVSTQRYQIKDSIQLRRLHDSVERENSIKRPLSFTTPDQLSFHQHMTSFDKSDFRNGTNIFQNSEVKQFEMDNETQFLRQQSEVPPRPNRHRQFNYQEDSDEILFYFDLQIDKHRVKQIAVRRYDSPQQIINDYCKDEKHVNYQALKKLEEFLTIKIREHTKGQNISLQQYM